MEAVKADGEAVLDPEALEALQLAHVRRPLTVAMATLLALTLAALVVPAALVPVRAPLSAEVAPVPSSPVVQDTTRLADLLVTQAPPGLVETELAPEYANGLSVDLAAELLGSEDPAQDRAFLEDNGYRRGVLRHWEAADGSWLFSTIYELESERAIARWMDDFAYIVASDPAVELIDSPVPDAVAYRRPDADGASSIGFEVFFGKANRLFHIAAVYPPGHPPAMADVLRVAGEQYRRG